MDQEETLLVEEEVAARSIYDSTSGPSPVVTEAPLGLQDNPPQLADFVDDKDDPRHKTYKPFVFYACLAGYLLFQCQMVSSLSVLPDTMVTWLNDGISCNGSAAKDDPKCKSANAKYTLITGIASSIGCFITFIGSPMLGSISDSYGRRKPIIFCAITVMLQQFTLVCFSYWNVTMYTYLGATIIASFDATSILLAYLSDAVPPSKRSFCFGLLFASATLAVMIGPFVGSAVSVNTCFLIGFIISVLYVLQVIFLLPESLADELRVPFEGSKLNPFKSFGVLTRYTMFSRLAMMVFTINFIERGKFAINYSFLKTKFGVTESFYSWVALTFGIMGLFTQSVLLKFLVKRTTNQRIMMLGMFAIFLNMVAYSFIWQDWQVFVVEIFSCIGFISFPAISAMKSNNVDDKEQGMIQGALYGVRQLAGGVGPVVFGAIFNAFTKDNAAYYSPSFIWYLASVCGLIGLALGMSVPTLVAKEEKVAFERKKLEEEALAAQLKAQQFETEEGLRKSEALKSMVIHQSSSNYLRHQSAPVIVSKFHSSSPPPGSGGYAGSLDRMGTPQRYQFQLTPQEPPPPMTEQQQEEISQADLKQLLLEHSHQESSWDE